MKSWRNKMKKFKKKAIIDENYCVACGCCAKVCPLQIIHIDQGVIAKINYNKCIGCGKCAKACPASIITIEKKRGRVLT
ncbi:MAG: 4Fe-4S dicluster-binding protein [Terrisporobacter sp.]